MRTDSDRSTRPYERRMDRPSISLPILSDGSVFISAHIAPDNDDDGDTTDIINIRCRGEAGFIPHWLFEKAMRWMKKPRCRRDDDPRALRLADDEYKFFGAKVTLTTKRVRDGVAMVASIDLRHSPEGKVVIRKFTSVTCDEIASIIKVASATLEHYKIELLDPDELHSDERSWLMSFDVNHDSYEDEPPEDEGVESQPPPPSAAAGSVVPES